MNSENIKLINDALQDFGKLKKASMFDKPVLAEKIIENVLRVVGRLALDAEYAQGGASDNGR